MTSRVLATVLVLSSIAANVLSFVTSGSNTAIVSALLGAITGFAAVLVALGEYK